MRGSLIRKRNIHPQNIIIDDEKYIKLTNFSNAKHLKNQRTYTICGSAEYLAPEIINDEAQGHEVDWWAFGILIFEMLTGIIIKRFNCSRA
jgi:serine/threonine protein kinase